MNVVLLSPPFLPYYMRNARCDFVSLSATQWFPIWLGYCGALLEARGHRVRLIDAPASGLSMSRTMDLVRLERPDLLVVYTGWMSERSDVAFIDRLLDVRDCPAVLVGPYFSMDPGRILASSRRIRYGVAGEFEYPILEFLEGRSPERIANFFVRENGDVRVPDERPYLRGDELDALPFVSDFFRRHADFGRYRAPSEPHPFVDILTGRGCCWGVCSFCLWAHSFIKGRTYNARSIANVIEELAFIERSMPSVRSLMIQDDTLPADRARILSEAKLQAGIKLPWSCYARADIPLETLRIMKESGCRTLHVGFESSDDRILRSIGKGLTRERMTEFMADASAAGLRVHGDFAIGFPGETRDSARNTVAWACRLRPRTAQFQIMIPYPGTPFHAELKKRGWLSKNGRPSYPGLAAEDMDGLSRKAYLRFYASLPFLKQLLRHPHDLFFSRPETYWRAASSLLRKKPFPPPGIGP